MVKLALGDWQELVPFATPIVAACEKSARPQLSLGVPVDAKLVGHVELMEGFGDRTGCAEVTVAAEIKNDRPPVDDCEPDMRLELELRHWKDGAGPKRPAPPRTYSSDRPVW